MRAWCRASGPEWWFQNTVISHSEAAFQSTLDAPNGVIPWPFASAASASSSSRLVGCCQPLSANSVLLKYSSMVSTRIGRAYSLPSVVNASSAHADSLSFQPHFLAYALRSASTCALLQASVWVALGPRTTSGPERACRAVCTRRRRSSPL